MKKIIIGVILSIFLISNVSFAQEESPEQIRIKNIIVSMLNSTVLIFSESGQGCATCSGVVIENNASSSKILTAKHCTDTFESVYVEGLPVDYIVASSNDDLALLILDEPIPEKNAAKLAENPAKRNDVVYHMGFPSLEAYVTVGQIFLNGLDQTYAKMRILHGCSGGGVWNNNGELTGIAVASMEFSEDKGFLALFEPIDDVKTFLRTIK